MPITTPRPTSREIYSGLYLVQYQGADFLVHSSADGWKIRRRYDKSYLVTIPEQYGLGKEEAIRWLEENY